MPPRTRKSDEPPTAAYRQEVLQDFRVCCLSREASVIARKEVLSGRANFGIIGDGKEVAQVALAKAWRKGDFRAGYYRDQTLIFALGLSTLEEFFAQLYGDPYGDPFSGGRQMNCHFSTPLVDEKGRWTEHKNRYNITADTAPTAGQMARGLGLAFASKKYREQPSIGGNFSNNGDEITFLTIGDASTSEGAFWETMNAAGVLQVPLAVSVWDDGYGISVPKKYQTVKESISAALAGMQTEGDDTGMEIYHGKGWDYAGLCQLYRDGVDKMRVTHRPALFHIQEITQQLGHSTSGDHRRYKSSERLAFEEEFDCNRRMANWMVETGLATREELETIKSDAKREAVAAAKRAYKAYHDRVAGLRTALISHLHEAQSAHDEVSVLGEIIQDLGERRDSLRYDLVQTARRALFALHKKDSAAKEKLAAFINSEMTEGDRIYSRYLMSETPLSPLKVPAVAAEYSDNSPVKDGYEVLNACFDHNFATRPNLYAFGRRCRPNWRREPGLARDATEIRYGAHF